MNPRRRLTDRQRINSRRLYQHGEVWALLKLSRDCADCLDIDLSTLMPELDSTASEIVGQQRDALVERKDLAQKTKDFRKLEDAAKLTEYKSLLKCSYARNDVGRFADNAKPIRHSLI